MNVPELWLYEQPARERGDEMICGCDEAGAGPLAGPVYAANALPSYFRFDADLESPAAADGAETIAPALP